LGLGASQQEQKSQYLENPADTSAQMIDRIDYQGTMFTDFHNGVLGPLPSVRVFCSEIEQNIAVHQHQGARAP